MVPTLTCGLDRSNFSLAIVVFSSSRCIRPETKSKPGADDRDRTGDLVLTKDALCQLSYIGLRASPRPPARCYGRQVAAASAGQSAFAASRLRRDSLHSLACPDEARLQSQRA